MTDILWVLLAVVVGAVALVVILAVVILPVFGIFLLVDRIKFTRRWQRIEEGASKLGMWAQISLAIAATLAVCAGLGMATLDQSNESFGWPDVPQWISDMDKNNGDGGCDD